MLEFEKKVADFIKVNDLFSSKDRVLLAVSGGADSIALLYLMRTLTAEKILNVELFCAHINHQLRADQSDIDERSVVEQAAKLKIPITTKRVDVHGFGRRNKLSIETAARKLRMESLLDIAGANNCSCIAMGHQKNDNAETVLQRLSRGTGFRGLGGIWPIRIFDNKIKPVSSRVERFVRPLLCVTRDEIIQYLRQQNLKWQTDHTNADCSYRRNYIRHRLLPSLQQQCESCLVEQLCVLSRSAQRFYSLVCSRAEKVWPKLTVFAEDKVLLNLKGFLFEPEPVKVELIRRCLAALGSGEKELTQQHYEKILSLADQNISSKKMELPSGFKAYREYENLIFCRVGLAPPSTPRQAKPVVLEIPGQTQFGKYLIEAAILDAGRSMSFDPAQDGLDTRRKTKSRIKNRESRIQFVERFDLDKLKLPLVVRFRQDGDRFGPLGLAGQKKVGKFLTAARIPQKVRAKVLVVVDAEKIIWVWPIRMIEQAKITDTTKKILQLQIKTGTMEVPANRDKVN
jgi:tRNA(Ile)-lysidine synthase